MTGATGDRWVVRYPDGEWGIERSSRRPSLQLFATMEDALVAARVEAASAGGGEVLVQAGNGGLSLRDHVVVADDVEHARRRPELSMERPAVARTVLV